MKKNVVSLDRNIRFILGAAILVIGYLNESWFGLIGLVPIFTGLINWCPIYALFKTSTIKLEK